MLPAMCLEEQDPRDGGSTSGCPMMFSMFFRVSTATRPPMAAAKPSLRVHEIEISKLVPGSLFYVLLQTELGDQLLRRVGGRDQDSVGRCHVDQAHDLDQAKQPVRSEIVISADADAMRGRIDRAVDKYVTVPASTTYDSFISLGPSLRRADPNLGMIRVEPIRAAAIRSRTKAGISGVIKTLWKPLNQ
jgi:hypothetical protein